MKKGALLIVMTIVCCGFTSKGQTQNLWDLIQVDEIASIANKPAYKIEADYSSDSIIGALHIFLDYYDQKKYGIESNSIKIEIDKTTKAPHLSEDQKIKLDEYALYLNEYSDLKVFISISTYQYRGKNYDWGEPLDKELENRAFRIIEEIKEFMMMKGVERKRVIIKPVPL